jgi:hypothetical protein
MRESKREREKMENSSTGLPVPRELKKRPNWPWLIIYAKILEKEERLFSKKITLKSQGIFLISVLCTNFLNYSIERSYFMQILKNAKKQPCCSKAVLTRRAYYFQLFPSLSLSLLFSLSLSLS